MRVQYLFFGWGWRGVAWAGFAGGVLLGDAWALSIVGALWYLALVGGAVWCRGSDFLLRQALGTFYNGACGGYKVSGARFLCLSAVWVRIFGVACW